MELHREKLGKEKKEKKKLIEKYKRCKGRLNK